MSDETREPVYDPEPDPAIDYPPPRDYVIPDPIPDPTGVPANEIEEPSE